MLREITWTKFVEWQAYDELDPIGEDRADTRNAHVVQTLINLHRREGRPAYPLSDFVLAFGDYRKPIPQQQSWQQMKIAAQQISAG